MASPIQQNGVATHPGSTPSQTAVNSHVEQVMGKIKTSNFGQKRNYSIIEISADKVNVLELKFKEISLFTDNLFILYCLVKLVNQ